MNSQIALRGKNALISGGSAFIGLGAVSCWHGVPLAFLAFPLWIVSACLVGLILGSFLLAARVRWSILIGGVVGIITGAALALRVISQI